MKRLMQSQNRKAKLLGDRVNSYTLRVVTLSVFIATSIMLYVLETLFLPSLPVVGVKLGLANLVILLLLAFYTWRECIFVTVVRVLVGSFITGTFFTPAFFFSMVGGITSTLLMVVAYKMFYGRLSFVGVSILGATAHNLVQLVLAAFLLAHVAVFMETPVVLFAALLAGVFNGVLANYLNARLSRALSWLKLAPKKVVL